MQWRELNNKIKKSNMIKLIEKKEWYNNLKIVQKM